MSPQAESWVFKYSQRYCLLVLYYACTTMTMPGVSFLYSWDKKTTTTLSRPPHAVRIEPTQFALVRTANPSRPPLMLFAVTLLFTHFGRSRGFLNKKPRTLYVSLRCLWQNEPNDSSKGCGKQSFRNKESWPVDSVQLVRWRGHLVFAGSLVRGSYVTTQQDSCQSIKFQHVQPGEQTAHSTSLKS